MSWCWLLLMFISLLPAVSNAVQSQQTRRQNCSCDVSTAQPVPDSIAEGFVEGTIRQLVESSQQLGELKKQISVVEGLTKQLTTTNEQLRGEFDSLQEEQSSLKKKYQKLENHQELLQQEYTLLTRRLNSSIEDVAFHAHHSSDPFSVASHGIIVYNTVTINIGQGYDTLSGIFTAPVSGTYSFFLNCMAVEHTHLYARIVVKGAALAFCWSQMPGGQPHEQGATQTIVRLNAGEKAWVDMLINAQNVRGSLWSSFTGFLVRAA